MRFFLIYIDHFHEVGRFLNACRYLRWKSTGIDVLGLILSFYVA